MRDDVSRKNTDGSCTTRVSLKTTHPNLSLAGRVLSAMVFPCSEASFGNLYMRFNVEDSGANVRAPPRSPGAREKTAVNMTIIMSMNMTSCEQLRQPAHWKNLDFMQIDNCVGSVQFLREKIRMRSEFA